MQIQFNIFWKKSLGTLYKDNEVDLDGKEAFVNLDLSLVDRLEVNYLIEGNKYTDEVIIKNVENKEIIIPFKPVVLKKGINEFEVVAYMKNGDIKTSQTYSYSVEEAIGEGQVVNNSGHIHTNLTILNSITQDKLDEWNNKSAFSGSYNDLVNKPNIPSKTSELINDSGYLTSIPMDKLVVNNIVNSTLTLTTDKYQTTVMENATTIILPLVNNYTEIHLFFNADSDLSLILPNAKYQNTPSVSANKTYEFIFTYTNEWLCGVVEYE